MFLTYAIWQCWLLVGLIQRTVVGLDPKFDPSTRMRLVLVPADATVGSVIYRLRATDDEFEYPLQFELVGEYRANRISAEQLRVIMFTEAGALMGLRP